MWSAGGFLAAELATAWSGVGEAIDASDKANQRAATSSSTRWRSARWRVAAFPGPGWSESDSAARHQSGQMITAAGALVCPCPIRLI